MGNFSPEENQALWLQHAEATGQTFDPALKLREPRVHRVIAPLLQTEHDPEGLLEDDLQYVEDQGLIRRKPVLSIAHRIYRELLPRELTSGWQTGLSMLSAWYISPDHRLDMPKLLTAFQQFFRESSDNWLKHFDYQEAGPQLLL